MMLTVEKAPPGAALGELKAFLRIEDSREDAVLAGLLRAATETVEAMLGLLLFEREVEERGTAQVGVLMLTAEPARTLVDARAEQPDGSLRPLSALEARLQLDSDGAGRIVLAGVADGTSLVVRYRAGMATDWNWVPETLRLAVIRAASHFFSHRDAADDAGLPPAVKRMIGPWRTRRI
jgi:uncharacterized phiE125 gp8 family phage protein